MKHIGFLALALIVSFTQVNAQKAKDKVDMAFDKTVDGITAHDFGSIVYGANGKVDFNFTNQGTKPLTISNVESSCGCTVPTWTKEPVEPGKQGTVTVGYNTKLPGVFNKTVVVTSNANNSPVRLEIRGKVNVKPGEVQSAVNSAIAKEPEQAGVVNEAGHVREGNKQLQEQKAAQARIAADPMVNSSATKPAASAKPAANTTKAATTATKPATTTIKKN